MSGHELRYQGPVFGNMHLVDFGGRSWVVGEEDGEFYVLHEPAMDVPPEVERIVAIIIESERLGIE